MPNKDLVVQTERDYKNLGLDVGVLFGDRKEYTKTHNLYMAEFAHVTQENKGR